MFYFNVTLNYTYEYNATQSKSYTEVKDGILKDVNERLSGYVFVLGLLKNVMMVSLIFVVIKALIYKKKFQTNDKFDNIYITFKLRDVEERRIELGKEGIFPLTWKEEKKYIKTRSPGMALREIKALAKGLFLLLISGCHTGFYLLCDYGLYWLLNMLKGFFSKKIAAPIPPHLKIHVHGKGSLSDMYRSLLTSFDPMAMEGGKLKPAGCIPTPSIPNWRIYRQIGFIYLVCLLMTIFQAYGLRLRHVIGACYYPRRERARAVWLYNHILKTRGGFLKFARRQLRRKAGVLKEEEKISIRSRLMAQFPLCRRFFSFLGFKRKHCLSCGNEGRFDDNVNFHHCQNKDCEAVYCLDCFTDLNNMCTVCMNPVDYGDHSDISEERDSSEDEKEMLKRRAEAEKLRQEREIQLQKRRPSEQMREMRKQFGITESVIKIRAEAGIKGQKDGAAYEEGYDEFEEYYEEGEDVDLKEKEFLSYQDIRRVEDEYDDGEYDADDDKSQTDYVTDDIFDDGEDDFIGDYDYPYIEPEELDMDRDIVSKTELEV
ncbi:DC-STAMP domain-containing protein 2-like [Saccostrea cucullata]|uniref:DC-STAMP domain-containing protein 2-like n=1 Tax=Saccostrea cuccullata TaxID=36930 RepID=UPI002ED26869